MLMKWEVQRPLSPLFPTSAVIEDYVERDSWWREWDPVVRGTFKALRVIVKAFRHWRFRKRVQAARVLHTRHLSSLVDGYIDPDNYAPQKYQAKYKKDYWNGTWMLDRKDITQWWYRKEHESAIARLADFLRACGYRAWHPKDVVVFLPKDQALIESQWQEKLAYAKQNGENMADYLYPNAAPGKRKKMSAIQKFYSYPPAPVPQASGWMSLDPDGAMIQIPDPRPKREWFVPLEPPWKTFTTRQLRHISYSKGVYYKYEDVQLGFGNVYEHEGLWTVVGPVYRKHGRLYTTWYRTNGEQRGKVARLQIETPQGTLKGTLSSKEEVDILFKNLNTH